MMPLHFFAKNPVLTTFQEGRGQVQTVSWQTVCLSQIHFFESSSVVITNLTHGKKKSIIMEMISRDMSNGKIDVK